MFSFHENLLKIFRLFPGIQVPITVLCNCCFGNNFEFSCFKCQKLAVSSGKAQFISVAFDVLIFVTIVVA